jgi:O-antigen ligase
MIKWLFKYGVVIFLFNSILLSIESTYVIGNQIFLALMGIFLFVLLINPKQIKTILFHKAFSFLLIINLLNLLYFFLFHSISDYDAIKYLMARGVQFSIISTSIYFNYEYYKNKFFDHLVYVVFGIVVFGLVINPSLFSGRYSGIIWNPNMFSSLVVIAFSIHFLKYEKRSNLDYFILFTLLISALASGSRGSLVAIILVFLLKYGFTLRNIMYGLLALGVSLVVVSINLETSLNRFAENNMFNDRILQFEYAYLSIQEKLFTGYGLDKYAYIDKTLAPIHLQGKIIGAHNGYLAILTQYGIVFGSIVLFLIFRISAQYFSFFKNEKGFERAYLFIVIYTLIASLYEALMTGINEFHTILFWFSLAILSYSKFIKENAS